MQSSERLSAQHLLAKLLARFRADSPSKSILADEATVPKARGPNAAVCATVKKE
jgi:hypothetical protein